MIRTCKELFRFMTLAAVALMMFADPGGTAEYVTIRTSVASDGTQGNDMSGRFTRPAISGNGRFTAYDSIATNLVPGDTNFAADIFVHDAVTGETTRVSVSTSGQQANDDCTHPAISANGRFVAFDSDASTLTPGDTNQVDDVFVHDREQGVTFRVSIPSGGGLSNDSSFNPAMSADGRFVAFISDASNLVPGVSPNERHIYVHDILTRTTEVVSVASDGTLANSSTGTPSISADGQIVAFSSFATNLVPGDTNGVFDVFVRDRSAGTTGRISEAPGGGNANDDSFYAAVSGNGRFVAFQSEATNLIAGDTNGVPDVFLYDRVYPGIIRLSVSTTGEQADGQSVGPGVRGGSAFGPSINFNGTRVAFDSIATNLVPGDTNVCAPTYITPGRCPDIFVRDWVAGTTERVSVSSAGAQANHASTDPMIDALGRGTVFFSAASNLVAGDTNFCVQFPTIGQCPDIFVHYRSTP